MMLGYEETRLWQISLGEQQSDSHQQERLRLRNAYYNFRERAAILAAEIPQDLREYTVHDATHLDALWELADIISGADISITPVEGFVLGGAFLLHDLGMGLAAWPGGVAELIKDPGWKDIVATTISHVLGRPALPGELESPPEKVMQQAKQIALRERHASRAAELGLISWTAAGSNNKYYLIEDSDLRSTYGHLIGRIAASHWWSIDRLNTEFGAGTIGAPVDCPGAWTVDPLKLACILRLADAAHVDSRRAPRFLMAIRSPAAASRDHWIFQSHIQKPQIKDDQLVYTSPQPFSEEEVSAWWLCFDTLTMVDSELHRVDALLADRSLQRMAAKSVKGIDSPFRLSSLIPTVGWTPVDARVVVSNVPALARKLGGESLYGHQPQAALRELIQNAADATRALAALIGSQPPGVKVILRRTNDQWWVDVVDRGIGMSQQLLAGPLLDFGRSYWGSQLMREESPGLAASGFEAAGRYGIGFYAVFMLGDTVKVVSRRYDAAASDTKVLTFMSGLEDRPTIRPARRDEALTVGGTIVSVRLRRDPYAFGGLLHQVVNQRSSLREAVERLAPALAVNLDTKEGDGPEESCIIADDWKIISAADLLRRVCFILRSDYNYRFSIDTAAASVRTIERDGQIIGRATLAPSRQLMDKARNMRYYAQALIASGGLSVGTLNGVCGIFLGEPIKADRVNGSVVAGPGELILWATEQVQIWMPALNQHPAQWEQDIELLCALGADMSGLHICCGRKSYLDTVGLEAWASSREMIIILDADDLDVIEKTDGLDIWVKDSHLRIDLEENDLISYDSGLSYSDRDALKFAANPGSGFQEIEFDDEDYYQKRWGESSPRSIDKSIIQSIARAWGLEFGALLEQCIPASRQASKVERRLVDEDEGFVSLYPKWIINKPVAE